MASERRAETALRRLSWAAALSLALPATAASAAPVVQRFAQAEVDWTAGELVASGSAEANPDLEDVAARRIDSEKRALIAARARARAAIERLRVTASETGRARMARPEVEARVMGVVERACAPRDTRYYADGGVEVVIACPLAGGLALALAPIGPKTRTPTGGSGPSALIIDASGVPATPTLIPTLSGGAETPFVAPELVRSEALRRAGGVVYVSSLTAARAHPRAGESPVVVDVTRIDRGGAWRVTSADGERLGDLDLGCVADNRVVVVVAPERDG